LKIRTKKHDDDCLCRFLPSFLPSSALSEEERHRRAPAYWPWRAARKRDIFFNGGCEEGNSPPPPVAVVSVAVGSWKAKGEAGLGTTGSGLGRTHQRKRRRLSLDDCPGERAAHHAGPLRPCRLLVCLPLGDQRRVSKGAFVLEGASSSASGGWKSGLRWAGRLQTLWRWVLEMLVMMNSRLALGCGRIIAVAIAMVIREGALVGRPRCAHG